MKTAYQEGYDKAIKDAQEYLDSYPYRGNLGATEIALEDFLEEYGRNNNENSLSRRANYRFE